MCHEGWYLSNRVPLIGTSTSYFLITILNRKSQHNFFITCTKTWVSYSNTQKLFLLSYPFLNVWGSTEQSRCSMIQIFRCLRGMGCLAFAGIPFALLSFSITFSACRFPRGVLPHNFQDIWYYLLSGVSPLWFGVHFGNFGSCLLGYAQLSFVILWDFICPRRLHRSLK